MPKPKPAPPPARRTLPDLKPGNARATIRDNALTLVQAGYSKEQALATALERAGYRPPDVSPSPPLTTPSTVVH